jgi:hypothetical protein
MTSDLTAPTTTHPVSVCAAHLELDELMALLGVDGLVAAYRSPALLAVVDQHATAVREALARADKRVDAVSLAAYGRSVAAAGRRTGRELPEPGDIDWNTAGWHVLRLLGVCALAEASGCL